MRSGRPRKHGRSKIPPTGFAPKPCGWQARWVRSGRGEPVILLHGIPTWGYLWHTIMEPLARRNHVLIPDLLGFGYSDKSDRFDRSISVQAGAIDALMDSLEIDRAMIAGHDIGGGVALRLAALRPNRVSRLLLMNSVCYDSWPIEGMIQTSHPEVFRTLSAAALVKMQKQLMKGGLSRADSDIIDALLAPYATEVGKRSLIRNAAALNTNLTVELTPLLPRIAAPTLILWGQNDRMQPLRYGQRLAWDIPNAEFVPIRNASHFVMLDQPRAVAEHLLRFIEQGRETRRRAA